MLSLLLALSLALPDTTPRGTVRTDTLWSQALGVHKAVVVYLPPSYAREPGRRYPVAVWLHGLDGNERNWVEQGRLAATMDSLVAAGSPEMIVVMPDGDDGWWTTWNMLGTVGPCRADTARAEPAATYCVPWTHYDDYVAYDVVRWADSALRTLPDRAHRGIGGLSMGGYGAVTIALRNPDVFSAAASHSGVLAPLMGTRPGALPAHVPPNAAELERRWGRTWPRLVPAFGRDTMAWWARDPGRLAARLAERAPDSLPHLWIDAGRDDPYMPQSRAFHRTLDSLGVAHRYAENPGRHDWVYWRREVGKSLAWMAEQIR